MAKSFLEGGNYKTLLTELEYQTPILQLITGTCKNLATLIDVAATDIRSLDARVKVANRFHRKIVSNSNDNITVELELFTETILENDLVGGDTVEIVLPVITDDLSTFVPECVLIFNVGDTNPTINFPPNIKWRGNNPESFTKGTHTICFEIMPSTDAFCVHSKNV